MVFISTFKTSCWISAAVKNICKINAVNTAFSCDKGIRCYCSKGDDKCQCKDKVVEEKPAEIVERECKMPPERGPPGECAPAPVSKKKGILWRMGMRIIDGGTNFGSPFKRLLCRPDENDPCHYKCIEPPEYAKKDEEDPEHSIEKPKQPIREGVKVAILGADTELGQYVALLLKQCPVIRRLHLYETKEKTCGYRSMSNIVQDLGHIDTSTIVCAFSCDQQGLQPCICNSDIIIMLDSGLFFAENTVEHKFCYQAPAIKKYADCIANVCPEAFIICCAHPIDCLVPLIAETLKDFGCYAPSRLLGSLSVPEMRASTLAARALTLEPNYVRVPCVGGTEGETLVPLFSRAVEGFTFSDDKLLNKLEENEPELASCPEEECVICVNAKATMQTSPCGHRVVCRRCFVKTIQMAVSQRLLPLRCVICRAKILRLRQAPRLVSSKSWQVSSGNAKSWGVPGSVSCYSVGARSVPASASLYSVTSGESSLSGVSSISSNSGGGSGVCSSKLCGGASCGGACLGAVPRAAHSAPTRTRQPASSTLRRSQHHSMKVRLQEYQPVHSYTGGPAGGEASGRLPPIREFQREFREGRRESLSNSSTSTRIRCAQKLVTQLETSPKKKTNNFFRPLLPHKKDETTQSRDSSKETEHNKETPKLKQKEEKPKPEDNKKPIEKNRKEETSENKKNETIEKKKEEKLRLKAEKDAKKEAKLQAKIAEKQAKLLAKEEERKAKLLAKEEKKKAKKEAKLAAQAEKDRNK